ncbi:MAG: phage tail tape measure protein [Rubellimicrobium sp.]|nr:phage tail tape measure protein [Rubellimicrobium sp.]
MADLRGGDVDDLARMEDAMADFSAALHEMRAGMEGALRDLGALERGFSGGLRRAFDGLVLDGRRLSDVLEGLGRSMAQTVYNAALRPVSDHFGGILAGGLNAAVAGLMPFAQGGAFVQGAVTPFAAGGVVATPTAFAMRGGTGLMGEAGPEAIMPLARGPDGRLGVQAQGGGRAVNVTINVATPDLRGFEQSRAQIAASVARLLGQAGRNG